MSTMNPDLLAGVDVGGTFTDVVIRSADGGLVATGKVPSTPEDQSVGILQGFEALDVDPRDVGVIVHGTTVATNALIEGRGARAALLTTRGFTDVIELRNRHRPHMYGLVGDFEPLIPRERRFAIEERVLADGSIVSDVTEDDVARAIDAALAEDIEAIGIGLLHAYANPANEQRVAEIVRDQVPEMYVCTSSEISAEVREYERFSTLAANACLMPLMSRYLERLDRQLSAAGFTGSLLIVQSNGGVAAAAEAARQPVNLVLSGPAAGVTAAQAVARTLSTDELVALDMGGTSLDLSVVRGGTPRFRRETAIRYGVPLRLQMTDITTVGAGGGSIAHLDARGILQVGPESAGAQPGPACYGRGGKRPTVTDANVVLGRLGVSARLGGEVHLDERAASDALKRELGQPLGLDAVQAAVAVTDLVANNIVGHIRRCTVDEGLDPRQMSLVSFGGAGGLHAGQVLKELELREVVVPALPGVLSAAGCTTSEFKHDYAQTLFVPLDELDADLLPKVVAHHEAQGQSLLAKEGVDAEDVRVEVRVDMQYRGQTHTVLVPLSVEALDAASVQAAFEVAYSRRFGRTLAMPPVLVTLRTTVVGARRGTESLPAHEPVHEDPDAADVPTRRVHTGHDWVETPVMDRQQLPSGWQASGPLLVEQKDTTIYVDPGLSARVDAHGQLILERS